MLRFYLVPIESVNDGQYRGPEYFAWRFDQNPPSVNCQWSLMDYGLMDWCLVLADTTTAQHNALRAQPDVFAVPADIDQHITSNALPTVREALEAMKIPAGWVNTSHTYREILRMIAGLFQFAERYHGMWDAALIDSQAQLDVTWSQIPMDRRQRILAVADSFGYDYADVTVDWTVRRILKHLADAWGETPFYLGGVAF